LVDAAAAAARAAAAAVDADAATAARRSALRPSRCSATAPSGAADRRAYSTASAAPIPDDAPVMRMAGPVVGDAADLGGEGGVWRNAERRREARKSRGAASSVRSVTARRTRSVPMSSSKSVRSCIVDMVREGGGDGDDKVDGSTAGDYDGEWTRQRERVTGATAIKGGNTHTRRCPLFLDPRIAPARAN